MGRTKWSEIKRRLGTHAPEPEPQSLPESAIRLSTMPEYTRGDARYGAIVPDEGQTDAELEEWTTAWCFAHDVTMVTGTLFIKRRRDGKIRVVFAGKPLVGSDDQDAPGPAGNANDDPAATAPANPPASLRDR